MVQLQPYEKQQAFQNIHSHAEKQKNMCLFKYNSVWIPYTATEVPLFP